MVRVKRCSISFNAQTSAQPGYASRVRLPASSPRRSAPGFFRNLPAVNRIQLEHIIRASAANADVREVVIVGSQAILGAFPDAPEELLLSMEADVFPKDRPSDAGLIDGAIGELSVFHETFGYYAHGVDESTTLLPLGWRDRLIRVEMRIPEAISAGAWSRMIRPRASWQPDSRRISTGWRRCSVFGWSHPPSLESVRRPCRSPRSRHAS